MVISTSGDPIIQVHKSVGEGAREAASSLPLVDGMGMRAGHAELLENALADTRKSLEELGRVADVGAVGAGALSEQDQESGQKFSAVQGGRRG